MNELSSTVTTGIGEETMPEGKLNPYGRMRSQMLVVLLLFGLVPLGISAVAGLKLL